jgi:hypothetical protein
MARSLVSAGCVRASGWLYPLVLPLARLGGRLAADYPRISRWAAAAHRDVGPRISSASRPYGLIHRAGRNGQPIAQTGHESLKRHCDELLGEGHDAEMAPVE